MTYNPTSANPFQSRDTYNEWSSNNLILKDPVLRAKSGINVLDDDIREIFNTQVGGAQVNAPLHLSKYASPMVTCYDQVYNVDPRAYVAHEALLTVKPSTVQSGGFPSHYYNNDRKW